MSLRQASASSQGEPGAAQEKWTDMNIEATSIPEDRPSPDSEGSREELGERNELMYVLTIVSCARIYLLHLVVSWCEFAAANLATHRQGLSERHIQMIALAGTIGTVSTAENETTDKSVEVRGSDLSISRDFSLAQAPRFYTLGHWEHCEFPHAPSCQADRKKCQWSSKLPVLIILISSLGYLFVGILVSGVVMSIAELR